MAYACFQGGWGNGWHLQVVSDCQALNSGSDPQACQGGAQGSWQWQQQGVCILREVRAMGDTQLQGPPPQGLLV